MNETGVPQSETVPKPTPSRGLGRATPVAVFATVIPILGSILTVAVAPFIAQWLREQGWLGVVYFTVVFAIAGTFTLATTYTTSVIAGWTFGFAKGFPAVIVGVVTGAIFCYLLSRRYAAGRVQEVFREHRKWDIVRRALLQESHLKTLWIVFLMRLSPVLPFGTTNVLLATTGVRLDLYVLGTVLGLLPRVGLVALAAAGAERLDLQSANSWWVLTAGLVATGICIVVMAVMGRRALDRATRDAEL